MVNQTGPESKPDICVRCGKRDTIKARGLCSTCYNALYYTGLEEYPKKYDTKPPGPSEWTNYILDEWVQLRDDGYRFRDAAPRLGISVTALDQMLARAKRRGDPRGARQPFGRDIRGG